MSTKEKYLGGGGRVRPVGAVEKPERKKLIALLVGA